MKIRTGFVSNSSSSSFIITGKDNIEKAKYIIDNAQDIYGDYYEVNDKLFTSGISDCSEIFSQLCSLTQEDEACALNGEPYAGDDDEEVEDHSDQIENEEEAKKIVDQEFEEDEDEEAFDDDDDFDFEYSDDNNNNA